MCSSRLFASRVQRRELESSQQLEDIPEAPSSPGLRKICFVFKLACLCTNFQRLKALRAPPQCLYHMLTCASCDTSIEALRPSFKGFEALKICAQQTCQLYYLLITHGRRRTRKEVVASTESLQRTLQFRRIVSKCHKREGCNFYFSLTVLRYEFNCLSCTWC